MTPQDLRKLIDPVPRVKLACLPTPLQEAPNLTRTLGGPRILIKRDDLTGLAFGGNKARKLEFIMADAQAHSADVVILSAAAQSNMCRMTAAAARQLGIDNIHLVLRGTGQEAVQGNLLLDHLFGATIHFIDTKDPYSQLSIDTMNALAERLCSEGRTPYIIDLRYQSVPLAAVAYALASAELADQINEHRLDSPYVVTSAGSGSTQAGLVLGAELLGRRYRVVGISVHQPADKMIQRIRRSVQGAAALLGLDYEMPCRDVVVDDRWIGSGYGIPTPEGNEALRMLARTEGVVLDPVYTAKAFSGLIGWVRDRKLTVDDTVIFLHTGGTPALFALADQVVTSV